MIVFWILSNSYTSFVRRNPYAIIYVDAMKNCTAYKPQLIQVQGTMIKVKQFNYTSYVK